MDGARVTPRKDAESERPPGGARQVFPITETWRQNIYSPKQAHYIFSNETIF